MLVVRYGEYCKGENGGVSIFYNESGVVSETINMGRTDTKGIALLLSKCWLYLKCSVSSQRG